MRAEYRALLLRAVVVIGFGVAVAVVVRWPNGGAEPTRNAATGGTTPLRSPGETANGKPVARQAPEDAVSSPIEAEAREALRLRTAFKSAPNLAAFVQDALGSQSSVGRYYAAKAYDHCSAAAKIFTSDRKYDSASKVAELVAQEKSRCEVLLAQYPDLLRFLAVIGHGKDRDSPSVAPWHSVYSRLRGIDRRSPEARGADLAIAMQISDPNLVIDELRHLGYPGRLFVDGKLANERQRYEFGRAAEWVACERGAECRLWFAMACLENESLCSNNTTLGDFLRVFLDKESYEGVAQMHKVLTKSWDARDVSMFLAPK